METGIALFWLEGFFHGGTKGTFPVGADCYEKFLSHYQGRVTGKTFYFFCLKFPGRAKQTNEAVDYRWLLVYKINV